MLLTNDGWMKDEEEGEKEKLVANECEEMNGLTERIMGGGGIWGLAENNGRNEWMVIGRGDGADDRRRRCPHNPITHSLG